MAVGLEPIQPIQAGASSQPLVTSASDVVTPDAVAQLTDAFRKGFITTDDVINRVGDVGRGQKKALLEQLGEYVNPDVIKSRMAAATASTAQSSLAQNQANAAQSVIQPATNLQQQQIGAASAATVQGPQGLQAMQQLGPWYGETVEDYRKPDGTYDLNAAASRGNQMAAQMNLAQNWIGQLTPASERTVIGTDGSKYVQQLNKFGLNVTPPHPESGYPGAPAYWAYVKQLNQFLPDHHPLRGQWPMVPTGGNNGAPGAPTAAMAPADTGTKTTAADVVQPAGAAATAPADTSAVEPQGVPISPGQTTPEARKALEVLPGVEQFQKAQPLYANFLSAAVSAQKTPPGEPTGTSDLTLGETYGKLLDPSSTLREFKWDAIKKAIPWADEFSDAKNLILRTHTFPPAFKQRLIDDGFNIIENSEKAVAPKFQYAAKNNPGVLDSAEQDIAKGIPFRQRMGYYQATGTQPAGTAPAAPAAGSKRTVNLPGVGPVIVNY